MATDRSTALDAVRYDKLGAIRSMATADGYLLVRRPGCAPFVLTAEEWNSLARAEGQCERAIGELRRRR